MNAARLDPARSLMRRVARGDADAAAKLFEKYADSVFRYLRGCGTPETEAEDVTQEVFVKALLQADGFKGTGSLEGWLLRIARSCLVSERRRELARHRRERKWAGDRETATVPAPERRRLVQSLLASLEQEDREVIVLAKFLELPTARIAEVLDIAPGTARVRLHRALQRLAKGYREAEV